VLIAEDNPANQLVLVALLEKLGHRPHVVTNGQEALHICQQERFDLILLDVQMPEMDGPEAARWFRQGVGGHERTPIVAVTAHVAPRDRESFRNSGMDEVLVKPVLRQDLTRLLARLFGSPAPHESPTSESPTSDHAAPSPASTSAEIDLFSALARLEGDCALLRDLIAVFHRDWPRWASEIQAAVESQAWPQVAFKAHRLRGLVRTFSAPAADAALSALEASAQACSGDEIPPRWRAARACVEALSQHLAVAKMPMQ